MKKVILAVLVVIVSMAVSVSCLAADLRTISVTGEAQVMVVPEQIRVDIDVANTNPVLTAVVKQNKKRVEEILTVLNSFQIDIKTVQTGYIDIKQCDSVKATSNRQADYLVTNQISFSVKNDEKFESVVQSVLEAGGSDITRVDLKVSNLERFKTQAITAAVRSATTEAKQLALQFRSKVGKVIRVEEQEVVPFSHNILKQGQRIKTTYSESIRGETYALRKAIVGAKVKVVFELLD